MGEPFKGTKVKSRTVLLEVVIEPNHVVGDELDFCQGVSICLCGVPDDDGTGHICHWGFFRPHRHCGESHEGIIVRDFARGVRMEERTI